MRNVENLRWDDHRQPPPRTEQRQCRNHERHPSVGVLCEGKPEPLEHLFRKQLLLLWQVLVSNERRIPDRPVKSLSLSSMKQKPSEKISLTNFNCRLTPARLRL